MKVYAKINLMLRVIAKRNDGYHDLQMVNCRVSLFDNIKIKKSKSDDVVIYNNNYSLKFEDDLILKTIKAFKQKFNIKDNFLIKIKKNIPVGAGLGGASMCAGAIIKYFIKKYNLKVDYSELSNFLKNYGADIPYSLCHYSAFVEGIGEKVEPIKNLIKIKNFILLNPNIYVSTKEVFLKHKILDDIIEKNDAISRINKLEFYNSLETAAFELYPELKKIKIELMKYGKVFMTGSGSTLILVPTHIKNTYKELKNKFPDYFIKSVKIRRKI